MMLANALAIGAQRCNALAAAYGALLSASPTLFLEGKQGLAVTSGKVTAWTPVVGQHGGSQTVEASRPAATTLNGRTALGFDGLASFLDLAGGTGWEAGESHVIGMTYSPTTATGTSDAVLDWNIGALTLLHLTNTSGKTGYHVTADVAVANATTGAQHVAWVLDATTDLCTMYRNGASIGTGAYTTHRDLSVGVTGYLGALGGIAWYFDGIVADLMWRPYAATPDVTLATKHYAYAKLLYGLP